MAKLSEQAAALQNLQDLYLTSLGRGCKTITFSHQKQSDVLAFAQNAQQEQGRWYTRVVEAQRRLIASGFDVPDSWLLADTMGTVTFSTTRQRKKPVLCVRVAGPDWKTLSAVCDEMRVAFIRVTSQPQRRDTQGYSVPDGPEQWGKLFKVSARTFKRYVQKGKIHADKLSSKSYRVLKSDLPS